MLRPALLGCVLSCAGIVGCRNCPTCGGRLAKADTPTDAGTQVAVDSASPSPYAAVPAGPVVHQVLKPVVSEPAADPVPATTVHADWQTFSGSLREKLAQRRTFTDVTANPAFAHAPDYSWLVGELRAMGPGVWSVRFASVDEDRDTVVLVDAPPMVDLHPGQLVRVEGQLVDAAAHDARAAYRVTAIHAAAHE